MTLEETTQLYASVLRQLLPVGGYDNSPNTETLAVDVYAHAKLLAQADLDAKRLLSVLEAIPSELLNEYEAEYGLPLKCTVNASRTFEERLQILNWVRTSRNVLNRAYLEQLLAIFGVTLIDIQKFKPLLCTAPCNLPVNTEQLRYKVFLRLQYPMNADMNCIVENYLPGYLRVEWMVDMPWGDWIINPGVTINTTGIAHYTAYKTNQREYYDSYANLDLTEAIVQSLHDADMQQWQAVKDALNTLTQTSSWTFDNVNKLVSYNAPIDSNGVVVATDKYGYGHINFGQTLYKTVKGACKVFAPSAVNFYINGQNCQAWAKDDAEIVAAVSFEKRANPNYNVSAPPIKITLAYQQVAKKIISNTQSTNQAISLLAEAYVDAVANSIFNADESKQFVKFSDLLSQFELNKTLRT